MEADINLIGARIKKQRERLGYSQRYMASELGMTQTVYGRLEKDDNRIDVIRLKQMAKILKTTTKYLLWAYEQEQ